MSEPTTGLSLLRQLQARELLAGFPIIQSLDGLRDQATYKGIPFVDYIDTLQTELSNIPVMALWATLDPGTASAYLTELTRSYELVVEGLGRVQSDAQCFLGRVKTVHAKAATLKAPFLALWSIGAADKIGDTVLKKLSASDLKALATMEFSTFLDEADLEWAAVIETVDIIIDNIKLARKLAGEKYAMGKDQINAVLQELDIPDVGLEGRPTATKRAGDQGVHTLRGLYGDRVQAPEPQAPTPETDDELPEDLRIPPVDLDEMPPAEKPEFSDVDSAEEADAQVLTPEGSKAVADLQVGDEVSVVTEGTLEIKVESVTLAAPVLTKPKPGKAVEVPYPINLTAPGNIVVQDHIVAKGKTKFHLTAQEDPSQNGVWRWMGPDVPMSKVDGEDKHPEPTHEMVQAPAPVVPAAVPHLDPKMEQAILNDPFLGPKKGQEVVDAIRAQAEPADEPPADDDLPPEEPAEGSGDDFPTEETAAPQAGDDDDDLPPEGEPVNHTPATHELAEGAAPEADEPMPALDEPEASPVAEEPPVETPKPEEPKVAEPAPVKVQVATSLPQSAPLPPATPKPGSLFRSRVVQPGAVAAPAFRPTKPVEPVAPVTTAGIDEVM